MPRVSAISERSTASSPRPSLCRNARAAFSPSRHAGSKPTFPYLLLDKSKLGQLALAPLDHLVEMRIVSVPASRLDRDPGRRFDEKRVHCHPQCARHAPQEERIELSLTVLDPRKLRLIQ